MTIGAEHGEIAEVGSPVIVPADPVVDTRRPLRWTSAVIATAAVLLSLLNAPSVTAWLDEQTPTPATAWLRGPVTRWERATAVLHLGALRATLHKAWEDVRTARFGAEQPGEPGTD